MNQSNETKIKPFTKRINLSRLALIGSFKILWVNAWL